MGAVIPTALAVAVQAIDLFEAEEVDQAESKRVEMW